MEYVCPAVVYIWIISPPFLSLVWTNPNLVNRDTSLKKIKVFKQISMAKKIYSSFIQGMKYLKFYFSRFTQERLLQIFVYKYRQIFTYLELFVVPVSYV